MRVEKVLLELGVLLPGVVVCTAPAGGAIGALQSWTRAEVFGGLVPFTKSP